jgi:hypothetical protein
MANRRKQRFRLVRATALRPVWDGILHVPQFECWVLTTGRLQAVSVCGCEIPFSEKAHSRLIFMVGWDTLRERGGVPCPPGVDPLGVRSAVLHVSYWGPEVDRAPPFPKTSPVRSNRSTA